MLINERNMSKKFDHQNYKEQMKKENHKARKQRKWKKQNKREYKQYRKIMENHLGRKLVGEENIHHINLNRENNDISNLHLFTTKQAHRMCHLKLEKLLTRLIEAKIIRFCPEKGEYEYFLHEEMDI